MLMKKFREWCYNALPVIGFLTIWFGCSYLTKTYFNEPIGGAVIGFIVGGWILTYKEDAEHEEKVQRTREEMIQEYNELNKKD